MWILLPLSLCVYSHVLHQNDVIMGAIASQITSLMIVYSIVYSDADQRKHQSSVSLALVRGSHRGPVNSPHKWPVTRKMFPFDDVIMFPKLWAVWSLFVLLVHGLDESESHHVVPDEVDMAFLWLIVAKWIWAVLRILVNITVYPKKNAHGFCFAVLCCGYTLTDFPISIRLTSLALWQYNDCPSASKATLMNMDKHFMWIHYERLHNHNKAKHNKTVCIFLGIYCIAGNRLCDARRNQCNVLQIKLLVGLIFELTHTIPFQKNVSQYGSHISLVEVS